MAIVTVTLTDESLMHLRRILDALVDLREVDGIQRGAAGGPNFRPLVDVLHRMVAGCTLSASTAASVTINAPTPAQTAIVNELENMLRMCVMSINMTNTAAGYELVLKV